MAEVLARLEADYCPPLDPSLLSAILSDYDLENAVSLGEATQVLDELRGFAALEEQTDFDPSGTGAHHGELVGPAERAESCPETDATTSAETDGTSLSNGVSSLDLDESAGDDGLAAASHAEQLENLDDETKINLMQEVFGDQISRYTVVHTLKKCGGKWQAALEELLSHVYLHDAEHSDDGRKMFSKGIDGFFEDRVVKRGRKGKNRSRRSKGLDERGASSPYAPPVDVTSLPPNKWRSASEDIEFISSRTGIASATVHSLYYEQNASVPRTIGALLKVSMEESKLIVTDDATVMADAQALGRDYPNIAPDYLAALIRLTHPSTAAARELATALVTKPKTSTPGGIQVIPQYAPVVLNDENAPPWRKTSTKPRSAATSRSPSLDSTPAAAQASAYDSARLAAFSQARAAHRRAKSNHLMGGAAAYYGEVGREYSALSMKASAAAANSLAASQSSPNQVDLHGIDVLNAVRISQEKLHEWWSRLGEQRVNGRVGAADRASGYRIIVGAGRHSEGGKGKLGPAVSKMLRQDGWKMENAGAVIVVHGRAR